jgi:tetratricopeptide (TPR) repeat protein
VRKAQLAKALSGLERVASLPGSSSEADHSLAWAHFQLTDLYLLFRQEKEARQHCHRGLQIAADLALKNPGSALAQQDLAAAYERQGRIHFESGDYGAAKANYLEARDLLLPLTAAPVDSPGPAGKAPDNRTLQRNLAVVYYNLGRVNLESQEKGDLAAAQEAFAKAAHIREGLVKADPKDHRAKRDLASSYDGLGDVSLSRSQMGAARKAFHKALAIREDLGPTAGTQAGADLAASYINLGKVEEKAARYQEALGWYQRALTILRRFEQEGRFRQVPDFADLLRVVTRASAVCQEELTRLKEREQRAQRGQQGEKKGPVAVALEVTGRVQVERITSRRVDLRVDDDLWDGDRLVADPDSSATLSFTRSGKRVRLIPGAAATVGADTCTPPSAINVLPGFRSSRPVGSTQRYLPKGGGGAKKSQKKGNSDGKSGGTSSRSASEPGPTPVLSITKTGLTPAQGLCWDSGIASTQNKGNHSRQPTRRPRDPVPPTANLWQTTLTRRVKNQTKAKPTGYLKYQAEDDAEI